MNFFKTIKKTAIASLFVFGAFLGTGMNADAQQVSLTPSARISNFTTNPNTNSAWSTSGITANPGDVIAVEVGYLVNGSVAAQELRVRISPRNQTASSIQYQVCIDAQNALDVCDYVTLTINDGPQDVAFNGSVFVYEYNAGSPGNAALVANTISSSAGLAPQLHYQLVANRERIFQSDGMRIGDINPGQQSQGSLTAHFQIQNEPVGPTYSPSVNISANPSLIAAGQQGQINWQVNDVNLNSCQATMISGGSLNDWGGNSTPNFNTNNGSTFISGLQAGTQYTFRLTCQGLDGSTQNDTVSITVQQDTSNPVVRINGETNDTVNNHNYNQNLSISWYWSETQPNDCVFDSTHPSNSNGVNEWNVQNANTNYNSATESGSRTIPASVFSENQTYTFSIECNNSGSGVNAFLTVNTESDTTTPSNNTIQISTGQAINEDEDSATLQGSINSGSNLDKLWYVYADNQTDAQCPSGPFNGSPGNLIVISGSNFNSFPDRTITGLNSDTRYYFRACAKEGTQHYSGQLEHFDTLDEEEEEEETYDDDYDVATRGATNRTSDSARLNGEITGGQDVDEVFFVLKKNNNGSFSCTSGYSEYISVSGNADDAGEDFDAVVYDLEPDTRYRYRACLREDGDVVAQGNIKSFTTQSGYVEPVDPYIPPVNNGGVDQINTTNILTYGSDLITRNTAVITGVYKADGCSSLQTQFQIGNSPTELTTQTSWIERGNATGVAREELSNLSPGGTYYYRFAGICDGRLIQGDIMSFRTKGAQIFNPTIPTTPSTPSRPTTVTRVVEKIETVEVPAGNGCIDLAISNNRETVSRGEQTVYEVTWQNTCSTELDNALIDVKLADDLEFIGTTRGQYSGANEHSVFVRIGSLGQDEDGTMFVTTRVKGVANTGQAVIVEANIGAIGISTDSDGDERRFNEEAIAFDVDNVFTAGGGAASAFLSGFFASVWGWLSLLLLLVLLVLGTRYFYATGGRPRNGYGYGYAPAYMVASPQGGYQPQQGQGAMYGQQPMMYQYPQTVQPIIMGPPAAGMVQAQNPMTPAQTGEQMHDGMAKKAGAPTDLPIDNDYTPYNPNINS